MAEIEIGILSNPIVFTGVIAGQEFLHPNNPFYLWNDKGGVNSSVDAREITLKVLELNILDELLGTSNGNPSQQFTTSYLPVVENDNENPVLVKVNGVIWTFVYNLSVYGSSDEVYEFDFATGTITFGDNINGKIPNLGDTIEITYTPNMVEYGSEIAEFNWLGVRSNGVISNPRTVLLERQISVDISTVVASHVPIVSVSGVYLGTDSHRTGTNYFTGGVFNAATGIITLGTVLPDANTTVLIDYVYTIQDDAEAQYTQIGNVDSHTFLNAIPSNNAKLIYLRLLPPATVSPSGFTNLRFRIRLDFKS